MGKQQENAEILIRWSGEAFLEEVDCKPYREAFDWQRGQRKWNIINSEMKLDSTWGKEQPCPETAAFL